MAGAKPLWKCPKCGVSLVVRNLSHACGDYSIAKFLKGKSELGRALFAKFEALIARCGPYEVAPAKTRVAFLARVRFASVNRVGKDAIDVHFVLPRALASRRFRRVEKVGNVWVHHLRLTGVRDFDRDLARWLREAYAEYGEQRWLESVR